LLLSLNYKGLRITLNMDLELVNRKGDLIKYKNIPHIEVGKYGTILNGRVYLWSRILPLIKSHPIFGIGTDCLIYEYPQYDIIGQMRYLGFNTYYLTLCHNHFIQIAVSQGIPALIVYLTLLGFFFFYHRPSKDGDDAYLFYCFASAIFGYLVSTLVMDSSVCVAPVAWICLGMGIVIKEMNYLKEKT
jgi:hypothetical protein